MTKSREWMEVWTQQMLIGGYHYGGQKDDAGKVARYADRMMVEWEKRAEGVGRCCAGCRSWDMNATEGDGTGVCGEFSAVTGRRSWCEHWNGQE